jgi:alanine dehydrogenase
MRIGVPTEIKVHEYRVGLVPSSVRELVLAGHEVVVQAGCGNGIGCLDGDYAAAGARIVPTAAEVFAAAELVVKVKEPQPAECAGGCARARCCSPTCTWRPTGRRPRR